MEKDIKRNRFKITTTTHGGVFKRLLGTIVDARHRSRRKGISVVEHAHLSRYEHELKAAGGTLAAALHTDQVAQQRNTPPQRQAMAMSIPTKR